MKKGQMVRVSDNLNATSTSYGISLEMKKMINGVYEVEYSNDLLVSIYDDQHTRTWSFRSCDVRVIDVSEPDPIMFTFDPKHL